MRALVADALEPVLRPLVYREPLDLVRRHRERGEPVYIVSAALQEIVEALADDLGFDGALGTICEVVDGAYTGRSLRALHGAAKAAAVRELAEREGIDLAAVDRVLGRLHRPAVPRSGRARGRRQPGRALRRSALERGWPVLEFGELAYPQARRRVPAAALGIPLVLGRRGLGARRRAAY